MTVSFRPKKEEKIQLQIRSRWSSPGLVRETGKSHTQVSYLNSWEVVIIFTKVGKTGGEAVGER